MGLVFLVLSKFNIKHSVTDVISLIFISLIAMDPYIIYHIGFQFSFLVTFGLLLSRDWLLHTSSPFWQLLKISFISQMVITRSEERRVGKECTSQRLACELRNNQAG